MATTWTPRAGLAQPASPDRNWDAPLLATIASLDGINAIGALAVTLHDFPSVSLAVKVAAGSFVKDDGSIGTYAGTASQAITTATTKVLYLDNSGTLTVAASYPATPHVRLATVVAGASVINSITDDRICYGTVYSGPTSGLAVLVGGTLPVSATQVTSTSRIILTTQVPGGTVGSPYVSARTPGTGFTITSTSGSDTSTVAWIIIEP
jgi:hypothetical protein